METILTAYFIIAGISAFSTAVWLLTAEGIEGIDNFWDWVIYNLFWIFQPTKALCKFIRNLFKDAT